MLSKLFAKSKPKAENAADAAVAPSADSGQAGPHNRIWLNSMPEDVPATIADTGDRTLLDVLDDAAAKFGTRTAFVQDAMPLSFQDVATHSTSIARYLVAKAGVKAGDRVAVMMPNIVAYPLGAFGVLRAGGVLVNVNPLYTPRELEHQLNDAGVETVIILDMVLPTLSQCIANTPVKHVIVINSGLGGGDADIGDAARADFLEVLGAGAELEAEFPVRHADDLAVLQYTGGTTGLAKGAMLTHRNLVANLVQCHTLFKLSGITSESIFLTPLPLYHIFAFTVNMLMSLEAGAKNVLVSNPRDMVALAKTIEEHKPTVISGVNTLFNAMLSLPEFKDVDLSSMQVAMGGGAAVQRVVSERWRERTGQHIREGYGLSETSPVATFNPPSDDFSGTVGVPVPSTDISLRNEDGHEVALGEPGEICIRGPQVMTGYWNQAEATAQVMTDDGYFRSGDIGIMDERGYIRIADRKKDMILVSGFNVYPNEVEAVIAGFTGVVECACVGVPDERTGEAVKVFVVRADDTVTEDAILHYARENLAAYKAPKHIDFVDELPKSTVGKILRRELRDRALAAAE